MFGVELLGDVLVSPALRDADVESERQVILEELAMDDDTPDDVAHRTFAAQLFPDHPLGARPPAIARPCRRSRRRRSPVLRVATTTPGRRSVSLAGPIDHDEALQLIAKSFADLRPAGDVPVRARAGADRRPPVDRRRHRAGAHRHGRRALARGDDDREALDVVNHVLGGGLSSRLFEEIRERRGLAYSVYSGVSAYADSGAFQIYAGTQPEHVRRGHRPHRGELDRLVTDGITDDELDVANGYLTGAFELGLEDTGSRMARHGGAADHHGNGATGRRASGRWAAVDQRGGPRAIDRVLTAGAHRRDRGPHAPSPSARGVRSTV